jgi:hypothetical protein
MEAEQKGRGIQPWTVHSFFNIERRQKMEDRQEGTSNAEEEKMENRQATADNAKQGHINKCIKKTSM